MLIINCEIVEFLNRSDPNEAAGLHDGRIGFGECEL